jgi:hypothetical protein
MISPAILLVIALLVVMILVVVKLAVAPKGSGESGNGSDYELRVLFSPAERSFLGALENSLPDGVGLLAKVRLGDVFKPRKGLSPSLRTRANNRLNQKHVDFLLVKTNDVSPLAGVELDDSSHQRDDRMTRDKFVDEVFAACKLPLIHVMAKSSYNTSELREMVAGALQSNKPRVLTKGLE